MGLDLSGRLWLVRILCPHGLLTNELRLLKKGGGGDPMAAPLNCRSELLLWIETNQPRELLVPPPAKLPVHFWLQNMLNVTLWRNFCLIFGACYICSNCTRTLINLKKVNSKQVWQIRCIIFGFIICVIGCVGTIQLWGYSWFIILIWIVVFFIITLCCCCFEPCIEYCC